MATTNTFTGASAVPFNPNTQTFGSAPTQSNQMSMGSVNLNTGVSTPAQQPQITPIQPSTIPQQQNINTLSTQKVTLPQQTPTQIQAPTTNYAATYLQAQPTAQQQQDQQIVDYNTNLWKTIASVVPQMAGEQTDKLTAKINAAPELQKQFVDLNNQILQRNAELNQSDVSLAQGLQNIQDQAIPMQFITGQQASIQNQANLARAVKVSNINMLNALAQSTQGNIALAQQTAQEAVDLKYAPIKDMYNTLIAQQQAIQPLLTSAEKRISDQQSAMYDLQKTILTQKQNQETKFMDMLMKAPTDLGATPDQISKAISIYNQTGDPIKAFSGLTGADQYVQYYQTQNAARNTIYNGVGQLTIDNGYDINAFKNAIATGESKGSRSTGNGQYGVITGGLTLAQWNQLPQSQKEQLAYGKYQVQGKNIPSWTEDAGLGRMTIQQFLNSPDAQEKVFEKQTLANYAKYGNWDDVASVWFSGRPLSGNTREDSLGTTVPSYVAKVRANMGIPAQPTTLSMVTNPNAELWGKEYMKNGDISKIPKQYQTMALAYANQNVNNTPKIQGLVDKINSIDTLMNSPYLSSVVGPNFLTRGATSNVLGGATTGGVGGAVAGSFVPVVGNLFGALGGAVAGGVAGYATSPQFSGKAASYIGDVELLTSKETIDGLIQAKAQGATFGALSDSEQKMLRDSATKINNWAIKNGDGKVVGYDIDEESFINELNRLKTLAQKGIAKAGGNVLGGTPGQVYANSIIQATSTADTTNPYGFK